MSSGVEARPEIERPGIFASAQKLVLGNGLGQAVQLAALPLLSRTYVPEQFGYLGSVQAAAGVLVIVATLQMHLSIPLSRTDEEVRARVRALDSLGAAWALVVLPIALTGGFMLAASWGLAAILAVANTQSSVLVHRGRFGMLSLIATLRGVAIVGFQLALVPTGWAYGLVIGALVGETMTSIVLRSSSMGLRGAGLAGLDDTISTVRELRAFSLYGTLQELVSVAAFYAPVLLYARSFGADTAGQYVMSSRLVWAPVILFAGSLAQVLYHRLGQNPPRDPAELRALMPPAWLVLALLAACVVPFFLQPLYELLLGPGWGLAGRLIPLQVVWGVVFLVSLPARVICRVNQLQRLQLSVDAVTLGAIGLAFWAAGDNATTPVGVMMALAGIGAAQNTALTLLVLGSLRRSGGRS